MTQTYADVLERHIQQTQPWLEGLQSRLGLASPDDALGVLHATLPAVRDRLTLEEGAHLAAQLPMIIRGIFYERWRPAETPKKIRSAEEFLELVREGLPPNLEQDPEQCIRGTLAVLKEQVTPGQVEQVREMFPKVLDPLWQES